MSEPITPADLARDLGVSQLQIRQFLRAEYGKLVAPDTRWLLDDAKAARVRTHFRDKR